MTSSSGHWAERAHGQEDELALTSVVALPSGVDSTS